MQRAWTGLTLNPDLFPLVTRDSYIVGVALLALCNFALAFLSRRLTPLFQRGGLIGATAAVQVLGTALIVCDQAFPGIAFFGTGAASAVGVALTVGSKGVNMMLWCEFFSMMSPTRVALTYSLALVFGGFINFFLAGMSLGHLWPLLLAMPVANAAWAVDAIGRVRDEGEAHATADGARVSFPWQPVLLMATLAFANSFAGVTKGCGTWPLLVATVAVPLLVATVIVRDEDGRAFDLIYRAAVPAVTVAMLVAVPLSGSHTLLPDCLIHAGDSTLWVVTMVIFSSISYRYGTNPIWLNGIERGVRYTAYLAGWALQAVLEGQFDTQAYMFVSIAVAAVAVLAFSAMFVPNQMPYSNWGVHVVGTVGTRKGAPEQAMAPSAEAQPSDAAQARAPRAASTEQGASAGRGAGANIAAAKPANDPASRRPRSTSPSPAASTDAPALCAGGLDAPSTPDHTLLALACKDLADVGGLTLREREVLLQLAERRTSLQIEKALVIAPGTFKAHVNHIYAKLGIHARSELYSALDKRMRAERR